ncbi:hypothetical protein ABFS82_08G029800 [Erythranthe guttata]|uniref:uncharacterized protein LOC105971216 n=1 Tax=Erythranthe guttata TaxID=4155 RepID=UPI00064E0654|nr:PREDICTED: uncharacterized protein LOC105971216 [Erythranthe guttata]|eukprot:XP_012851523.1 PREDICTED: uncharacterized protein LOC105971216 [Erythranthe guttata]
MSNSTVSQMNRSSEHHSTGHKDNAVRGTEVFVGGLPRSITEEKIHKIFSACGEIVEIRMIKDQLGNLKGFCFVRFATKESAARAVMEKAGTVLDGKTIGVLPSSEQVTLYFGNLNKAWSADEFKRLVLQVFPDIESVDLPSVNDTPSGQKHRNRGFAFVKFCSHAAAARAQRVGSQPDFRLGNLHPAVQWAEEGHEKNPSELAKIKIAFVRNLPPDAEENYLKHMFEPFGKVEKVVVSKKASIPVGFVHFAERSDLERAIKEMNDRTVRGPSGGSTHKLQVEVARPMDKSKKRAPEESESNPSVQGHFKLLKHNDHNSYLQRELGSADPYEDAVIALPLSVKERLLRILRLGIATRFDIDVKSLCSLKELPESIAISVLDQFMLSGAGLQNKGAYLDGLISRHLVDNVGLNRGSISFPEVVDNTRSESKLYSSLHRASPPPVGSFASHAHSAARSDIFASHYSPLLSDYPLSSRTLLGRGVDRDSDFLQSSRPISASGSFQIPSQVPRIGMLEERSHSPYEATPVPPLSYGSFGLRTEEVRYSSAIQTAPNSSASPYARLGASLTSEARAGSGQQPPRQQIRFDPYTGEPYKFDPFTGEPIRPDTTGPF